VVSLRFLFPVFLQEGSAATLELDLEHYVVPTPTAPPNDYAANLAATPASLIHTGALWTNDTLLSDGIQSSSSVSAGPSNVSADFDGHSNHKKVGCFLEKWVYNIGLLLIYFFDINKVHTFQSGTSITEDHIFILNFFSCPFSYLDSF